MKIKLIISLLLMLLSPLPLFAQTAANFEEWRKKMVQEEIANAGVKNERVIEAMRNTPRHEFVPLKIRAKVQIVPITTWPCRSAKGKPSPPPFIVAYMTEATRSAADRPRAGDRHRQRLSSGGAQSAGQGSLHHRDRREAGQDMRRKTLERLKYANVHTKIGDGYKGWPEKAPFDKIIVTCSPEKVPEALVAQLKEGGRMVIPVGQRYQQTMYLLKKETASWSRNRCKPTLFVPMTGEAESKRELKPDAANPQLLNGGFEETVGDPPEATGWHYPRQMKLAEDGSAPEGKRYAKFSNSEPGRNCQVSARLRGGRAEGKIFRRFASTSPARISITRRCRTRNRRESINRCSSSSSTTTPAQRSTKKPSAHGAARSIGKRRPAASKSPRKPANASSASACSARPAN